MILPRPRERYDQRDEERRNQELEQADRQNWKLTGDVKFAHRLLFGDDEDSDVTVGITINQGSAVTKVFTAKNSGVAHALAIAAETDTFYTIGINHTTGGAYIQAIIPDNAQANVWQQAVYGGTASTTKSTAGRSLAEIYISEHDGANALANITANGNVFGIRTRVGGSDVTVLIVDEDGDLWLAGGLNVQGAVVMMPNLPTADPTVAGQLWNNSGVLTVSAG